MRIETGYTRTDTRKHIQLKTIILDVCDDCLLHKSPETYVQNEISYFACLCSTIVFLYQSKRYSYVLPLPVSERVCICEEWLLVQREISGFHGGEDDDDVLSFGAV
jgi:hypothetical protein